MFVYESGSRTVNIEVFVFFATLVKSVILRKIFSSIYFIFSVFYEIYPLWSKICKIYVCVFKFGGVGIFKLGWKTRVKISINIGIHGASWLS